MNRRGPVYCQKRNGLRQSMAPLGVGGPRAHADHQPPPRTADGQFGRTRTGCADPLRTPDHFHGREGHGTRFGKGFPNQQTRVWSRTVPRSSGSCRPGVPVHLRSSKSAEPHRCSPWDRGFLSLRVQFACPAVDGPRQAPKRRGPSPREWTVRTTHNGCDPDATVVLEGACRSPGLCAPARHANVGTGRDAPGNRLRCRLSQKRAILIRRLRSEKAGQAGWRQRDVLGCQTRFVKMQASVLTGALDRNGTQDLPTTVAV